MFQNVKKVQTRPLQIFGNKKMRTELSIFVTSLKIIVNLLQSCIITNRLKKKDLKQNRFIRTQSTHVTSQLMLFK